MITGYYNPRILAVDDNANMLKLIKAILQDQYTLIEAQSGKEAMRILNDEDPPDLILLDIMMPDMDGYQVFEAVKKIPRIADIPIIFVTALDGKVAELKGFEYGAVDYITKPFEKDILVVRIESALELHSYMRRQVDDIPDLPGEFYEPDLVEPEEHPDEPASDEPAVILSIDDDQLIRGKIEECLQGDYTVIGCQSGESAFEYLDRNTAPDLILLDITMPDADGFDIIGRLKQLEKTRCIPVIFLTARNSSRDEIRGFQSGAVDFVHKPIDVCVLKARISNQLRLDRKRRQFEAEMECFEED